MAHRILFGFVALLVLVCAGREACAGPVGAEFRVNSFITGDQGLPSVGPMNDGGFVVAWTSVGQNGDIQGQRYDASGTPVGGEFRINTQATGNLINPGTVAVAGLVGGGFVVMWDVFPYTGIHGRVFSAAAAPVGDEFIVSDPSGRNDGQHSPAVSRLADGGFVVAWTYFGSSGSEVYARRYTAAGTAAGPVSRANADAAGSQVLPAVAGLKNGPFVIVWRTQDQQSKADIVGQGFTALGAPVGARFLVSHSGGNHEDPSIAPLPSGGFVVAWRAMRSGNLSRSGIMVRCFTLLGSCAGGEIDVSTSDSVTSRPAVAALGNGGFAVTWTASGTGQDGSMDGVYRREFNAMGAPLGGEFRVNSYTADSQNSPAVAPLSGGAYVVTWESLWQDGSGTGIYGQRFGP